MCIKEIECIINYDVKVVEYFLKEKVVNNSELLVVNEFIYFVCIFEDINNFFYGFMFIEVCDIVIFFYCDKLIDVLIVFVKVYCDIFMMVCIYGQFVLFIIMGKEMVNVVMCLKC